MKHLIQTLLLCTALLMAGLASAGNAADWVGKPAPVFHLQDQGGQWHDLKEFKGHWLAIYFYPKDGTPGCTEEASKFRDSFGEFQKLGILVVGVSLDGVESHKAFADKLALPFPILADSGHDLAAKMGVLRGFGPISYARRETFLIDPEGTIVYHYPDVNTGSHAEQVLTDVRRLSKKP
jgi:peroxiredoxin Q/BCP